MRKLDFICVASTRPGWMTRHTLTNNLQRPDLAGSVSRLSTLPDLGRARLRRVLARCLTGGRAVDSLRTR